MTEINTSLGARLYISNAAVLDTIDTVTEFEGLTWVEVDPVENLGDFGDEAAAVTFSGLKDGRIRKLKGARDAGELAVVVGHNPTQVGQVAMIAAEATKFNYGFKVEIPDAPSNLYTNSVFYFRGRVMSKRMNVGGNGDVTRRTFNVGIDSPIYEDLSALI